jgi:hypothetical protein
MSVRVRVQPFPVSAKRHDHMILGALLLYDLCDYLEIYDSIHAMYMHSVMS